MSTEDKFKEWFKNTSLKDIPLAEFNFHLFERALAMAYSQGWSDRLDDITKEYDLSHKDSTWLCQACSEIKEDCVCLEPVLNKLDYEGKL